MTCAWQASTQEETLPQELHTLSFCLPGAAGPWDADVLKGIQGAMLVHLMYNTDPSCQPRVFSALYKMWRKPSSPQCRSYSSPNVRLVWGDVPPTKR
mmetsp:Transcript_60277/g.135737  ORF Transcript_60277/g.135737 Transcript_60277/m.135737 type:complete len:97 (-) Transcript_60277:1026-1316(-)